MYQLFVKIKAAPEKSKILELFFQDWVDGICNEEVSYGDSLMTAGPLQGIISINFKNSEDATVVKLRGIPGEFQNYLTIVDYK